MKIINAYAELIDKLSYRDAIDKIVETGSICYKSERIRTSEEQKNFILRLIDSGHESALEHVSFTIKWVIDRGISHEIVRHRLASYSQESTRYCNYSNDKFGSELTFIKPFFFKEDTLAFGYWQSLCLKAEETYLTMIDLGVKPQEARSVLPNSIKTELVMTCNLREWRYFFKLRTAKDCHPQMLEVTVPMLDELKSTHPALFYKV